MPKETIVRMVVKDGQVVEMTIEQALAGMRVLHDAILQAVHDAIVVEPTAPRAPEAKDAEV